jgi:glycosyltransferase involved in cell wall biosynthesis
LWPHVFAPIEDADLFHHPHNILPRHIRWPVVVTVHDVMSLDQPRLDRQGLETLAALYYPQAVRRALRRAARLIVPTTATADRVLAWQADAGPRLRVIPMAPAPCFQPPADLDVAASDAARLVGSDAPYVLVVGQNNPNKRHHVAVEAFAAACPAPWRLVLLQRLGAGNRLQRLAAARGVADRLTWLRHVATEEVATLMQSASALVQPSLYEGFGLPVVEAMACGCPVVASDIPPFRETTGGAALLVTPSDTAQFSSALKSILSSPDRRAAMAQAGLVQARRFSWDRTARETLAVYEEIASARLSAAAQSGGSSASSRSHPVSMQ